MILGQSVLGVITARGGSKGLPRKNILALGGRPLIDWSVEAGKGAALLDQLILSSDDEEILAAGRLAGCEAPFIRPAELAGDTASIEGVLLHALDFYAAQEKYFDLIVLLQATSPFRTGQDIDNAIRLCVKSDAPSCVSLCHPAKSPFLSLSLNLDGTFEPLFPQQWSRKSQRQGFSEAFVPNGAVYVAKVNRFRGNPDFYMQGAIAMKMPVERSVDIDLQSDLLYAQALLDAGLVSR